MFILILSKGVIIMTEISRRSFLAGVASATVAALASPTKQAEAASSSGQVATLIDLTKCDGCAGKEMPECVAVCRETNKHKFPKPDKSKIKDYWPQKTHEDWSDKTHLIDRLTPYNWTFVQKVTVQVDGKDETIYIPRRCMHCDNPTCSKLCPFGTNKKAPEGPVYIDPTLCFGGAKCRTVCPWSVPQRQAGVGIYTYLDPLPVGGGVMYKCDLCLDLIRKGDSPACVKACPQKAMLFGIKQDIINEAKMRAEQIGGYIYGLYEHGGTSTLYVSKVKFEDIDKALVAQAGANKKVMRMHNPENKMDKTSWLAKSVLLAPLAGIVGAYAMTVSKREGKDAK